MATKQVSKNGGNKKAAPPVPTHEEWPFAPFMDLRKRMDQLFDDYMRGWPRFPSLARDVWEAEPFAGMRHGVLDVRFDISEGDAGLDVSAELPGMVEKDIEVTLSDGVLTIKGEKKAETEEKKKDFHLTERRYGSFTRSFRVPGTVDQDKIKATFDKGVLHIALPKHPESKAKKKKISVSKK